MYILGHIGVTVAVARAADRRVDLRLAALMSILPDLIDKPIALFAPLGVHHNTRSFGHTVLGSLIVLAALWVMRRGVKRPALLWACYAGHFLLDRMWLAAYPVILFWPLLGALPPRISGGFDDFVYNALGEAAGAGLLIAMRRQREQIEEFPSGNTAERRGPL